jgi:hypothetical protein
LALAAVRQLRWHTGPVMRESVQVRPRGPQKKEYKRELIKDKRYFMDFPIEITDIKVHGH